MLVYYVPPAPWREVAADKLLDKVMELIHSDILHPWHLVILPCQC